MVENLILTIFLYVNNLHVISISKSNLYMSDWRYIYRDNAPRSVNRHSVLSDKYNSICVTFRWPLNSIISCS